MSETILTDEQRAVVDADLIGPRLVDAGAGTGKTFTLVQRAAALVRRGTLCADELLVVTFTKAAASEIADRLERELGPDDHRRPTCGTFHAIASDLLRAYAYDGGTSPDMRVIDDGRARGLFARAFADLIAGRLNVDLSAFPLLDRPKALERSLARMGLDLKSNGTNVSAFFARARDAASELEEISFGTVTSLQQNGVKPYAGWPKPDPARTDAERRDEAARERCNVDVVEALFAHFQALLDREHLLTFGDVIIRATAMLRERPAITAALRARWKHAIVDEFQDTNEGQIAFLKALFGEKLTPVLVVGDVRQAIYEFNGARPEGIVEFRNFARECLPLGTNRRSLQPILDAAYASLRSLGGVAEDLNAPLRAHRGDSEPTCVRLELFEGADALENEAACVAETIATLVARGVAPSDCAILLRARTRAGIFADALRARGLAVRLVGGVGFFDAPEIREVVAWLSLASDPTDAFAALAALQSASIGLGDGAVALLARGRDLARGALLDAVPPELSADERERLERFRRIARVVCDLVGVPLVVAVRSVIDAAGIEISRVAEPDRLDQIRANLDKFVRTAVDFASDRPLARIVDLVAELRERDELELDLPIAELEGDRISVLTIHGAKGLEWQHVFVADVTSQIFPLQNNDAREKVAEFDADSGALALKHGVDGRPTLRWFLTANPHDASGNLVKKTVTASNEEYRLLYVALTRARDAVYVSGRKRGKNTISKCFTAVKSWVEERALPIDEHRLSALHGGARAPGSVPLSEPEIPFSRELAARIERTVNRPVSSPTRRGALSYTAMELFDRCPRRARFHYVFGLPDLSDEAPLAFDVGSGDAATGDARESRDPARYGRVIHYALETLANARLGSIVASIDDALSAAFAIEGWSPSDALNEKARVAVVAASNALAALTPIAAERKFDVTIDSVALGGYIDLLARDAHGNPVIVDYKTGRTKAEHYEIQFALYAHAVHEEYPNAATRILRITHDGVALEPVVPASFERLRETVTRASTMESDEPRRGDQCAYCPYVNDACAPESGDAGSR